MGGLLHIFEFNQGRMARKVHAHKRHHGGQVTPRNSLDLQVETSQIYCPEAELPYFCQVEDDWSKNISYSDVASVKKLVHEELSEQSGIRNSSPSLVARLMGMDMMPLDTKAGIPSDESIGENMENKISKKGMNGGGSGSVSPGSSNCTSPSQMDFDSFYQDLDDDDGWGQNFEKLRPQEHPQEEELQKFKKEFEAYQAAMFKECSKTVEMVSVSRRMLDQERDMMESAELDSHSFKTMLLNGDMMESILAKQKEPFRSRSRTLSRDFEKSLLMKSRSILDTSSSPTQIVILKPSPDRICNCNHEEKWFSSSSSLQGRNSIEEFLEEVRDRLNCELQGKAVKKGSVFLGSRTETRYNEIPSDPKEIAHHTEKEARKSVAGDAETNLCRSESRRSYKSEIQFNEPSSPEFISKDNRRFLSDRLRNVVKSEAKFDIPEVTRGSSRPHSHRVGLNQAKDTMKGATYMSRWQILKDEKEMQTGCFRHEPDGNIHWELSPRNLVRSLSAPLLGTSFQKLLLESHHILTGAHKLEAVETMPANVKKHKKDRFNIKEKVSNFKRSLGLRGKLFGKRVQSIVESHDNEHSSMVNDIKTGPTFLLKCSGRHENCTEVPPTPASVCSNDQEEIWRGEYLSPISTPDVSSIDNNVINPGLNGEKQF